LRCIIVPDTLDGATAISGVITGNNQCWSEQEESKQVDRSWEKKRACTLLANS
jgi:hypothetical protein